MGWFNTVPFGGGDTLLWNELLGIKRKRQWVLELVRRSDVRHLVEKMANEEKVDIVGDVDVNICHFYHGEMWGRSYVQRDYMWASQYPWYSRIITTD